MDERMVREIFNQGVTRFFTLFVLVMLMSSQVSYAAFSGSGSGSLSDPYVITNDTQLQEMNNDLNANFSLGNNISANNTLVWNSGLGFIPIGNDSRGPFNGSLEGNGFLISHLFINNSGNLTGLFGLINNLGYVANLSLINVTIRGYQDYVGGLIGHGRNYSIDNVSVQGIIWSNSSYVGGLVGRDGSGNNSGSINNSYFNGSVNGFNEVGGLVGRIGSDNDIATIDNSYALGIVNGSGEIGGLVGRITSAADVNITNVSFVGEVNASSSNMAGLIGYADELNLSNSYFNGSIWGGDSPFDANYGGLVGLITDSVIEGSYALGYINGSADDVGGLIGDADDTNLTNSYFIGNVTGGDDQIAGLIGYVISDVYIDTSYAIGTIRGDDDVGGLVGESEGLNVNNSYFRGNMTGDYHIGGIVGHTDGSVINNVSAIVNISSHGDEGIGGIGGYVENTDVDNVYARGNITTNHSDGDEIGGIIGYLYDYSTLDNAYFIGTVSGDDEVGGVVGYAYEYSEIDNVYARANVTGDDNVGGVVGYIYDESTLDNSYFVGYVSGDDNVGGVVGEVYDDSTVNNSFAVANISGSTSLGGAVGNIDNSNEIGNVSWYSIDFNLNLNCTEDGDLGTCTEVTDHTDFYDVSTFPISLWNFTSVWDNVCDDTGFPVLQFQSLNSSLCTSTTYPVAEEEVVASSSGSSSGSGYLPKIYDVPLEDLSSGTSNGLRPIDQIKFNAEDENNFLILNFFNEEVAKVTIDINRKILFLNIGEDYVIDANNNGREDTLLRYEGIEGGRAKIFIQELSIEPQEVREGENSEVVNFSDVAENGFPWWILIILLIIISFVIYYIRKRNQ